MKFSYEFADVFPARKLAAGFMAAHSWLAEKMKLKAHLEELLVRKKR